MKNILLRGALVVAASFFLFTPCDAQTDPKSVANSSDARKYYDFEEPDASQILPNPATGLGNPPQLKIFVPVARIGAPSSNYGSGDGRGAFSEVGGSGGSDTSPGSAGADGVRSSPSAAPSTPRNGQAQSGQGPGQQAGQPGGGTAPGGQPGTGPAGQGQGGQAPGQQAGQPGGTAPGGRPGTGPAGQVQGG